MPTPQFKHNMAAGSAGPQQYHKKGRKDHQELQAASIGAWYHYVGVLSECTIRLPKMQPAVPANSSKGARATESEPASAAPEPLALGLPVIQNTASRHSHIVLLSL